MKTTTITRRVPELDETINVQRQLFGCEYPHLNSRVLMPTIVNAPWYASEPDGGEMRTLSFEFQEAGQSVQQTRVVERKVWGDNEVIFVNEWFVHYTWRQVRVDE